jgi:hypothetical protein
VGLSPLQKLYEGIDSGSPLFKKAPFKKKKIFPKIEKAKSPVNNGHASLSEKGDPLGIGVRRIIPLR